MTESVTVRPGRPADGPALTRIDLATWTPAVSPAPPPADPGAYAFFDERTRPKARKLSLRVLSTNLTARRLYEQCGFVVEGVLEREFLLAGQYVDDVFMSRHLAG